MLRQLEEIQSLATKYSKAQLGQMVQMGLIDPQKAMMAGMMIQRIEQQNAKPPQTTVAQDVLGMPPVANQTPQQPPQGMQGQPPMPPQGMPPQAPPQPAPQAAPQGMADGGVTNLHAGDVGNYAGGGIVAFADRGAVKVDPDWGDLPRGVAESSKIKVKDKSLLDKIKEFRFKQPDEKGYVENPLNFNMGKGLWKGTYATPYDQDIVDAAKEAGIDPRVYWRLLYTESKFDPKAESYKGKKYGYGIAQISHHHGIPEEDLEDPKHSIKAGAYILKHFLNRAKGDYRKGLQGYKGAVSEAGIAAMTPHIDKVLGDSNLAPPPKKKKLPKLKPGQVALHPVPVNTGLEVVRTGGEPTKSEIAAAKEKRKYTPPGAEDVYDIGSGNFITHGWDGSTPIRLDEYEQEGAPHYGGWFTRDELEGLPELRGEGQANGGLLSLAHGGYIPRFNGASGSWAETSAVPMPKPGTADLMQQQVYDEFGINPAQVTPQQAEAARQSAANTTRRQQLQKELKALEDKNLYTRPSAEDAKRIADIRAELKLTPAVIPVTPGPSAAPAAPAAPAENIKSLPPVTVSAKRIVDEDEEEKPVRRKGLGGFDLPGLDKYKVDIPIEKLKGPEAMTEEQASASRKASYAREGYDPEMYNKMIEKLEERKGDVASEKDKAIGQAIMMAGFKLMGARRGEEFQNLSEGAQEGLKSYQTAMEKMQARRDKLDERMDAYRQADAQARRTGAEADIARAAEIAKEIRAAEAANVKAQNAAALAGIEAGSKLRGQDLDVLRTQIAADATHGQTAALKEAQLQERMARTIIEAADAYSKAHANDPAYIGKPMLLQEDAMTYARKVAAQFMPGMKLNPPPAATPAPGANIGSFYKP